MTPYYSLRLGILLLLFRILIEQFEVAICTHWVVGARKILKKSYNPDTSIA